MIYMIEDVLLAITLVAEKKVHDVLKFVTWKKEILISALNNMGYQTTDFMFFDENEHTKYVEFNIWVPFEANEIKGIIGPSFVNLHVSAVKRKGTDNIECEFFHGVCGIASSSKQTEFYDADYVYESFCEGAPVFRLDEIINEEFDLVKSTNIRSINGIEVKRKDV